MKRLLWIGLLAVTAGPVARAVDVSGSYENLGAVVASPHEPAGGTATLRGLMALEFDPTLARLLYAEPARMEFTQTADDFIIRCFENDGKESWSGRWARGPGYGVEEKQVKLVLRSPVRFGDGFMFVLSPVSGRELLLVDVYSVKSTSFGPGMKPVGSYVFSRLPDTRVARR